MIKLFKPYVSTRARKRVQAVLSSTQLAEGPLVKEFEKAFEERFGVRNVVALNSGTTALELAYDLAGIKEGDEVITPVLTCTATNLPLVRRGAKIVFADIVADLTVDPLDVARKITPKTKAIVFVHFGGSNKGLDQIREIAAEHDIPVIEDAAQAVAGPEWGRLFGDSEFCCVSLQAIKTLTAGDGGFLIVKDDELYERARRLRWFGYDREEKQRLGDTDLIEAGYKYHMNDITAAIGLGNLRSLDEPLRKRKLVREWYKKHWNAPISLLTLPWLVVLFHEQALELMAHLKAAGIDCGQYHYRNDKYTVFNQGKPYMGGLPTMDRLEKQYLLLPYHHDIKEKDVRRIISEINLFFKHAGPQSQNAMEKPE